MNKIDNNIVKEASLFVSKLLDEKLSKSIEFHTIAHAKDVAHHSEFIAQNSGLTADEINIVILSAWFHDTGYIVKREGHEEESVKIATEFLSEKGFDKSIISQVQNCILSTRIPQQPENLLSKVLCDADLFHLTEENYFEQIEKMRKEWISFDEKKISKRKFHSASIKFFQQHNYHTDFARKELQPKKDINLQLLQKEVYMLQQEKEKKLLDANAKKTKSKGYSRGVESMFRNTARMQINLSSIADNKSNILISVNAIIISISMTVLVTRLDEMPEYIIPTLIFLMFCLVTIVFAILSTRPNISSTEFTDEDIKQNKVNLLFFGNFYKMKLNDYEVAIGDLMNNEDNLYSTMIKDQYFLGLVLSKKYKLLRIAYNVFMVGIVVSVVAFIIAFISI
ncbi:MAG: HD domain-containing protein [Bacteroidales bacterium]|nr:HD domain-containing protein [Bacteroidales bacterium]